MTHIIACAPMYLHATGTRDGDFTYIWVYKSPVLREYDPEYTPVDETLRFTCHMEVSRKTVLDKEMMFGRAEEVEILCFEQCPAFDTSPVRGVPHNCWHERNSVRRVIPTQRGSSNELSFTMPLGVVRR